MIIRNMHCKKMDSRINVVRDIISAFQEQLDKIAKLCEDDSFDWWDSVYADDTEHLVGTVFIVLQNYINSNISDLYPELTKLHSKYNLDEKVNKKSKTTRIQLIIALANYYKHRDLPTELHKYTSNPLIDLKLEYIHIYDSENKNYIHKVGSDSPIFNGFDLLTENWRFSDLINIVTEWRDNLWKNAKIN